LAYTTLWNVPHPLWFKTAPILPPDNPSGTVGRPALPNRQVLNGILFILCTGRQWKSLKKEWFGASSIIHDRYQAWRRAALSARIFQLMLEYYYQVKRIQWRWQAIDSKLVPSPMGGEKAGKNPTDRAKLGSKRIILFDALGAPFGYRRLGCECP
jgi:putative transposase